MSQYSRNYQMVGGALLIGGARATRAEKVALINALEKDVLSTSGKTRSKKLKQLHNAYQAQPNMYYDDEDVIRCNQTLADERRFYNRRARNAKPDFFYGRRASAKRGALVGNLKREPSEYNNFVSRMSKDPQIRALPVKQRLGAIGQIWRNQKGQEEEVMTSRFF